MDFNEIIEKRYSCRIFDSKPVTQNKLEKIVLSGILAPTAHNAQLWRAVVASGNAKMRYITAIINELNAYSKCGIPIGTSLRSARILRNAPAVIFILRKDKVFFDFTKLGSEIDEKYLEYGREQSFIQNMISIGTVIENMLLSIEDQGLQGICISEICYAKVFTESGFNDIYEDCKLVSSIAVGYAPESYNQCKTKSRKPLNEMMRFIT